jgi:hypothetical protein
MIIIRQAHRSIERHQEDLHMIYYNFLKLSTTTQHPLVVFGAVNSSSSFIHLININTFGNSYQVEAFDCNY